MNNRKEMPVFSGVINYFPDAIKEVAKCSFQGNLQHHPNKTLFWDKDKSNDHLDALLRHAIDHLTEPYDVDGLLHLSKVAWRALAELQIFIENQNEKDIKFTQEKEF